MTMRRRALLQSASAMGLLGLAGCASTSGARHARVVVVGGGYGGATAAKYLRLFSQQRIDVVLVEPNAAFVSCPLSNLVVGGSRQMADITTPYDALARRHGVRVVRDHATAIDTGRRQVRLARGDTLAYDKLVVSPGVELLFDRVEGLAAAHAAGRIVQAWHAGEETAVLRRQLEAMPDGGVFAITIPEAPYRCPPAPYERACQAAWYFQRAKPRSKVLILDANPDITSKGALFRRVWEEQYRGMIEYRPQYNTVAVDARAGRVRFEVQEDERADVINALPPMRAGRIAVQAGLNNLANHHWCGVDFLDFGSQVARDVHVLGDSIQIAPAMPKSGHMANSQAKVAAAAIVAQLAGWPVNPAPMLTNTCYTFVDDRRAMHVASVHAWDGAQRTFLPVHDAGGLSEAPSEQEGVIGFAWARNIWADMLA
jgi:NADPH-dependent 2,4-dienoyl-CoA reductase/sulfur reductase-like enzyme